MLQIGVDSLLKRYIVAFPVMIAFAVACRAQEVESGVAQHLSITGIGEQVFETPSFRVVSARSLVESSQRSPVGPETATEGREIEALIVTGNVPFEVNVADGTSTTRGSGIGVSHAMSGRSMMTMSDQDGDGQMDILTYSVIDAEGAASVQVIDYELDGQPDVRLHFPDGSLEIWHLDRWHPAEERDGQRGITVDGQFLALARENNRWIVP
jgi:hypothetical protein